MATTAVLVVSLVLVAPPVGAVRALEAAPDSSAAAARSAPSAPTTQRASTAKTLRTLVKQTKKLSAKAVRGKSRKQLIKLATTAQKQARKSPCSSVGALTKYRKTLARTKVKAKPKKLKNRTLNQIAGLTTLSTTASMQLLASKKTKKCGGGVAPSTRPEAVTKVQASTEEHLKVAIAMPQVILKPERVGSRSYVKLLAPGTVTPGEPGQPGVPVVSELFGVPDGAEVSVDLASSKSMTLKGVRLYPAQPEPLDDEKPPDFDAPPFSAAPFVPETPMKGSFPRSPAETELMGTARDLRIGRLGLATAQYSPSSDTLKIFTKLVFDVKFEGGDGFDGEMSSPWEISGARLAGGLLNAGVVGKFREYKILPCGEELMVITHADTLSEALVYANARTGDGFRTRTYVLGRSMGTTAAEIQAFIRSHVNNIRCIRPSYVTIIGDDSYVPTFTNGPGNIPSDNPYSMANDADELPDLAVGRILGNDPEELQRFIAKINHYQETPPTGPMLNHAAIAAQFQDTDAAGETNDGQEDRTFIQFAERARTGLRRTFNTVDRIYDDSPSTTPTHFVDGTPLPADLRKPGFAWDGDGADISAAWNEGRFLMVHRDHGWSDGWGHPSFGTGNVLALTNDNDHLPVLMSINCSSAAYDYDDTSFVQTALVKETGGAVAAFGDTRDSPSWHNSEIGLGFIDALLPKVLLGEGPSQKLRLGDALVHGKLRLAGLAPPSGPGIVGGSNATRNELYLWHLFGDPTMKMHGGGKTFTVFDPELFEAVYHELPFPDPQQPPPYEVELTLPRPLPGEPISLVTLDRKGNLLDVVGKAVGDGTSKIVIPAQFNNGTPDRLAVVVNPDDATPVQIEVPIER